MVDFKLREMRPVDSTQSFDVTTLFQLDSYQALIHSTPHRTVGVVAEVAGFDGLAGMATVTFDDLLFEGHRRPSAYLASLKVHPRFRRQGLGWQLARWRVERARAEIGPDGVIITGLERGNDASRATARKWCREFFEPVSVAIMPTRSRPPRPIKGITVRRALQSDFAQIAEKQNSFYQNYNLYAPCTPETLAGWLEHSPADHSIHHYFVAVDTTGEIIAGAGVTEQRKIYVDKLHNPPPLLDLLNRVVHLIPSNYVIEHLPVSTIWYASGQLSAAQQVWETIRWECRTLGTTPSSSYDPRGPLAVHGPTPMSPERLIYSPERR